MTRAQTWDWAEVLDEQTSAAERPDADYAAEPPGPATAPWAAVGDVRPTGEEPGQDEDDERGEERTPEELAAELTEAGEVATAAGSLRSRIVEIALREQRKWGERTETDPAMTATLAEYYRIGVGVPVSEADLRSAAWQAGHPWSAVFVSYVMRQAGAGESFSYSSAHRVYIAAAKRNAQRGDTTNPFWAYPIGMVVPEAGDLVCVDRKSGSRCSGTTFANVDDGTRWSTHCDIVTAVDRANRRLTVVGGNVSQSVRSKTVRLDAQGFVEPGTGCRYFAVVKVREGGGQAPRPVPAVEGDLLGADAIAKAIRLNRSYGASLGWAARVEQVARLLGAPGAAPAGFAQAVAAWQRTRGLTVDGIIGPDTWGELRRVMPHRPT